MGSSKNLSRCDEIMRRDEIRWFDGNLLEKNFKELCKNQCIGSGSSIVGWLYRSGSGSDQGPGFWRPKIGKILQWKIFSFPNFWSNIAIFSSLASMKRFPQATGKPSALKREHQALKNMKFLNFFSIFVVHFCPPGSTELIESGSNPDPELC